MDSSYIERLPEFQSKQGCLQNIVLGLNSGKWHKIDDPLPWNSLDWATAVAGEADREMTCVVYHLHQPQQWPNLENIGPI